MTHNGIIPINTAETAIPMPKDLTLLEILHVGKDSTANQYCKAIDDYIAGKISESDCLHIMSAKQVL